MSDQPYLGESNINVIKTALQKLLGEAVCFGNMKTLAIFNSQISYFVSRAIIFPRKVSAYLIHAEIINFNAATYLKLLNERMESPQQYFSLMNAIVLSPPVSIYIKMSN